jgi:hypothetical protein
LPQGTTLRHDWHAAAEKSRARSLTDPGSDGVGPVVLEGTKKMMDAMMGMMQGWSLLIILLLVAIFAA